MYSGKIVSGRIGIVSLKSSTSQKVFLDVPTSARAVLELNWEDGKTTPRAEFPTLARLVGVPLFCV